MSILLSPVCLLQHTEYEQHLLHCEQAGPQAAHVCSLSSVQQLQGERAGLRAARARKAASGEASL